MVVCPQLIFAVLITILDKTSLSEDINEYYTLAYEDIVTDLNDTLLGKIIGEIKNIEDKKVCRVMLA